MRGWTEAELAEMAAADAEIELTFRLLPDDMKRSTALDREAARDAKGYDAKKRRAVYLANRERVARLKKAWYESHREQARESSRKWYQKNKRSAAAYQKAYREANMEKYREYQREWYRRNRDKSIARVRKWQEDNRERYMEYQREYRKRKEPEKDGKGRNHPENRPGEQRKLRPDPRNTGSGEGTANPQKRNRAVQAPDRLGADRSGGGACADRGRR